MQWKSLGGLKELIREENTGSTSKKHCPASNAGTSTWCMGKAIQFLSML